MASTNVSIRMDEELKKQAEELFSDLGLNFTTAVTTFVKQSVREQRIPFSIGRNIPNEETILAIQEVEQMKKDGKSAKGYTDVDVMMTELLK